MSTVKTEREGSSAAGEAPIMDMKLEVIVIPVSDVDRAKAFYKSMGWRVDADFAAGADFRVVQLTPPGSGCSVIFGTGITTADPGSARACTSSSPTSRGAVRSSPTAASTSAACSMTPAASSTAPGMRGTCRGPIRSGGRTRRSPPSATRTATAGCSRRSRRGFRAGDRRARVDHGLDRPERVGGQVTRQRLEAADIPALLEPGDARAYMGASSAFAVKVPADRVTDAQEALQVTKETPMKTTLNPRPTWRRR